MLGIPLIEWVGYIASVLIAVSLTMTSIIKLRWINLVGASLFTVYAVIIGAIPVALVNGFISVVNIYFLVKINKQTEAFKLVGVNSDDKIFNEFLNYYKQDIEKLAPGFKFNIPKNGVNYLILKNMDVAGVFIGKEEKENTMVVHLDYVSPEYRDFKLGDFVYRKESNIFRNNNIKQVIGKARTKAYRTYFERMGFKLYKKDENEILYQKKIENC